MSYGRSPYYIYDRGHGYGLHISGEHIFDGGGHVLGEVVLPYEALAQFMLHIMSRGAIPGEFLAYLKLALEMPGEWITPEKAVESLGEIAAVAKAHQFEDIEAKEPMARRALDSSSAPPRAAGRTLVCRCAGCSALATFDSLDALPGAACPQCGRSFLVESPELPSS